MTNFIVVAIIQIVVKITIFIVIHVPVIDILDCPHLKTFITLHIRVIEGVTHGAVVGGQRRHLETVVVHLQHRDGGELWAGSVLRHGEAWR